MAYRSLLFSLVFISVLAGCKPPQQDKLMLPKHLVDKKENSLGSNIRLDEPERQQFSAREMPRPPSSETNQSGAMPDPELEGESTDFSLNQVPLASFIKIVFGDNLKLNIDISPEVSAKSELITFRTSDKKTPTQIFKLAKQVLASYGVSVKYEKNLYKFYADKSLENQMPLILRTRSTVDVPVDLRPIFQIVDLNSIDKKDMKKYMDQAFPGKATGITVADDANALIVYGTQDVVRGVVDAIRVFDRPSFAGRKSVRVNLSYLTADNLSGKLLDILQTEGYSVSEDPGKKSAVTILPVSSLNCLLIFAADNSIVSHALQWIKELDVPTLSDPNGNFYYMPIRNTEAREIGDVINQVLSKSSLSNLAKAATQKRKPRGQNKGRSTPTPPNRGNSGGKLVTDEERNGLIFYGTAEEYTQIKPLVDQMDVPARQVLIEVTIAEFRVNNRDERGFEGFLKDAVHQTHPFGKASHIFMSKTAGFFGQASPPQGDTSKGFNFTVIDSNNVKRAVAHLLSTSDRTTILSTPKLLTRSGGEARFLVGKRVPILKSRSNERTGGTQVAGTTPLVQDVAYEKAGIVLEIIPTVRAGRRVDIDISQEVSEVLTSTSTGIESPSFDETKVETKLSLSDGATVLLAGFIKDSKNFIRSGIPILKDLPAIGGLFRSDTDQKSKNEIIIMITPYIIDTDQEARDITNAFKNSLCWLTN